VRVLAYVRSVSDKILSPQAPVQRHALEELNL